jgi:hypothetical protein
MAGFTTSLVSFLFFALFVNVIRATELFAPVQTNFALDQPEAVGWTPVPTPAPYHWRRQEDTSGGPSTCGWVNGNRCKSLVVYVLLTTCTNRHTSTLLIVNSISSPNNLRFSKSLLRPRCQPDRCWLLYQSHDSRRQH